MEKDFLEVIKSIYTKNGVRSLLLKAKYFGEHDVIDYVAIEKDVVHKNGIGKVEIVSEQKKVISGEVAKNMCVDFVKDKIKRKLKAESVNGLKKDLLVSSVDSVYYDLLKTLGIESL